METDGYYYLGIPTCSYNNQVGEKKMTKLEYHKVITLELKESTAQWLHAYVQNYMGQGKEPESENVKRREVFNALTDSLPKVNCCCNCKWWIQDECNVNEGVCKDAFERAKNVIPIAVRPQVLKTYCTDGSDCPCFEPNTDKITTYFS
jgi:hypothetical protein